MTVCLSPLSVKLGRFLGLRMKEAQPFFHSGRLAYTTSLPLSLTLLPAPLFQAFLSLKAHGGTLQSWSLMASYYSPSRDTGDDPRFHRQNQSP